MMNFGSIFHSLLAPLNAESADALVFWTEEELYEFMAEAARLLGQLGVFVDRQPLTVAAADSGAALPERTLSILHVSANSASLRGINVEELEAIDPDWRIAVPGTPSHFSADVAGAVLSLYPPPALEATADLVRHTYPNVTGADSAERGPEVFGDYAKWYVLAEARSREGDGAMPDVAAHAKQRAELYRSLFEKYWTEAE